MERNRKIISEKIEDDEYNVFFQEMVLAERNYHKNEEAFNEHVNNILNMKNPDYIYRIFLNSLKNEKNISFLETFTSIDTIIQNSVSNSKSDIFDEMRILQDEVLNSIYTSDILDVSKCTLQMILHKINEFNIKYMLEHDDVFSFKVFKKGIGD